MNYFFWTQEYNRWVMSSCLIFKFECTTKIWSDDDDIYNEIQINDWWWWWWWRWINIYIYIYVCVLDERETGSESEWWKREEWKSGLVSEWVFVMRAFWALDVNKSWKNGKIHSLCVHQQLYAESFCVYLIQLRLRRAENFRKALFSIWISSFFSVD